MAEKFDYDVVIVGAGPGGMILALKLAKEGYDVALIERKPKEIIGKKVCGDGISERHFETVGIEKPHGKELGSRIVASDIISPDREGLIRVYGKGYTIDRLHFGQRLMREAEKYGAHIKASTVALNPIVKNNKVYGVKVRDAQTKEIKEITGRLTVDASGSAAVLRNKLPEGMLLEKKLEQFDVAAAYREIVGFNEDPQWEDDKIYIYLSHRFAPGGYSWVFPKGKRVANVGVGVQSLEGRTANPRKLTYEFMEFWGVKREKVYDLGGGMIPVRHALSQLVTDGLILVGDAGSQANPLHGGGIGQAMYGGFTAYKRLREILESGNDIITKEDMWPYAVEYMRTDGAKNASLEMVRLFLQGVSNDELNFIIHSGIVSGEELSIIEGQPKEGVGVLSKIHSMLKMLKRPRLLNRLRIMSNYYKGIYELFQEYPENPKDLIGWHEKLAAFLKKARKDLWRDPYQFMNEP
ncbi:MAG: geranylgeranyl reductase family protein [Candidatus Njordarchaeia archaeon]